VALASATAGALRRYILGVGPLFHVPAHPVFLGPEGLAGCVIAGILAGALSALLTVAVYAAEDAFHNLKIHWMWWPCIGGLAIGLGGLIFPQALGIGFDTIEQFLQSDAPIGVIAGVLLVKSAIWVIALGSGTSGGVLAPLLMMGAALGGVEGMFLPHAGAGFWPLISMGAILGGTMRSPFTGVVFAVELTHDVNVILPLLVASFLAHGFTVLTLRRSILTEKIARRGFHLSREYALDPLEILFGKDVLRPNVVALQHGQRIDTLVRTAKHQGQYLYPVIGDDRGLLGVVTRKQLARAAEQNSPTSARDLMREPIAIAYSDEPLRVIVFRMAERGVTRVPVLSRGPERKLLGMLSLDDLLHARTRVLTEERDRERVIRIKLPFQRRAETAPTP
jgi:chloride channel protein, CIC family